MKPVTQALPAADCDVLRYLGERVAEIGSLPIQAERRRQWSRLNRLDPVKPMVWINEVCWHEMDRDGELSLRCRHPVCRQAENVLRRTLYQWDHMPADMIVDPVYYVPPVVDSTGFGINEDVDVRRTDEHSNVVSRHFHIQIRSVADAEKIQDPVITHRVEETERTRYLLQHAFGDVLPVEVRGVPGFWFAPWDLLIRLTGVEEGLLLLATEPEVAHAAMDRLVGAYCAMLDQYEEQNLLALNNTNVRVGSGGYGCTDELPGSGFDGSRIRARDLWGNATAQIFSEVSPAMHEEFALQYERRWLDRFGLTYYGCCEPLDRKLAILRTVPNLRKVSMSPWVDAERAAAEVGANYVYSMKPSPAVLAEDVWNANAAADQLRRDLEATRGCAVEVIMKDISTVRYEPERLWEWSRMATAIAEELV